MEQEYRLASQKNYQHNSRELFVKKKKISLTSKIFKFLMEAPCSSRKIRKLLNNENNKHKKINHRPGLTMKHKEKRLEYTRQY